MKAEDIRRVLVVGGGTMGQQIALQFALHGCDVVIYDLNDAVLEKARKRIGKLVRFVAPHQRIPPERAEGVMDRIATTPVAEEAAAGADLVSESVPEDPELKGRVLGMFDALCPPEAVFTTNTLPLYMCM